MTSLAGPDSWYEAVDLTALERWMDSHELGTGPIEHVSPIGGGTQNILLRLSRIGGDYVLRRPPLHKRAESDEVMRREMRVLMALAGSDVPHPLVVAGEPDGTVLGAAFYLMRPVDGFNPVEGLPEPHGSRPEWRARMGAALVDALIALSSVDVGQRGLGDLGRTDGWLEFQVPRWRRQLEGYAAFDGWTGTAGLPAIDPICSWLEANRPASFRIGLMHGDYHLANVLYRFDSPALAAIVDWELATLGDPLLDLGWLLATWPEPGQEPIVGVTPWSGFPSAGELADRYLAATGRTERDAHWFAVLACFKLGVLLEGTHARACAGLAPKATGDRLHQHTADLFQRALRRIDRGIDYGF